MKKTKKNWSEKIKDLQKTTLKCVVNEGGQSTTMYRIVAYHCLMNQVPVEIKMS